MGVVNSNSSTGVESICTEKMFIALEVVNDEVWGANVDDELLVWNRKRAPVLTVKVLWLAATS